MSTMRTVSSRRRLLSASMFERWLRGGSNGREAMLGPLSWCRSVSCLGSFSMSPGEAMGVALLVLGQRHLASWNVWVPETVSCPVRRPFGIR